MWWLWLVWSVRLELLIGCLLWFLLCVLVVLWSWEVMCGFCCCC